MAVRSRSYSCNATSTTLTLPELAYRKIVSVKRSGAGFNIITTGSPDGAQVLYTAADGDFTFLNPFAGDPASDTPFSSTEKIFIIWEE